MNYTLISIKTCPNRFQGTLFCQFVPFWTCNQCTVLCSTNPIPDEITVKLKAFKYGITLFSDMFVFWLYKQCYSYFLKDLSLLETILNLLHRFFDVFRGYRYGRLIWTGSKIKFPINHINKNNSAKVAIRKVWKLCCRKVHCRSSPPEASYKKLL